MSNAGKNSEEHRSACDLWDHIPDKQMTEELDAADHNSYDEILRRVQSDRDRAVEMRGEALGPFLVVNRGGRRPPIFWCFNNWFEPHLLAAFLPADQPLYSFVSFHRYTERWLLKGRLTDPLAQHLRDNWRCVDVAPPAVLAGNCQGAPIAEAMALQYAQTECRMPRLVTLDYVPRRRYSGPYTMLFGEKSRFNPFLEQFDPRPSWVEDGMSPDIKFLSDAEHGTYFRRPHVAKTAGHLLAIVDGLMING